MKLNKKAVSVFLAEKKWNIPDLANTAEMSSVAIRRGFNNSMSPKYVGKIAEALGAKVEDIIQED